jgi:drug/metabolite transporter superfamily protein YnfA
MKTRRFNPLFGCFKNLSRIQSRKWLVIGLTVLLTFTSLAWISPVQQSVESGRIERAYATTTNVALRTSTATPAFYLNTGTPMPADWVNNAQQTNSIIVGAIILVLIVLVGTLTSLRAKK